MNSKTLRLAGKQLAARQASAAPGQSMNARSHQYDGHTSGQPKIPRRETYNMSPSLQSRRAPK
jgi:hypothetical protein